MKAFRIEDNKVLDCDEKKREPDGWVDENGKILFNAVDGGFFYTADQIRMVADYADNE